MKSSTFWDITLCVLLKANGRFGGMCRLLSQGWRVRQAWSRQQGQLIFNELQKRPIAEDKNSSWPTLWTPQIPQHVTSSLICSVGGYGACWPRAPPLRRTKSPGLASWRGGWPSSLRYTCPMTSLSPAQYIHFLVQRAHLVVPCGDMQLEGVPHVGTFLQVLHVTVQAAECRGHRQHPVLQFTEVQTVEFLQLVLKSKHQTLPVTYLLMLLRPNSNYGRWSLTNLFVCLKCFVFTVQDNTVWDKN